MTRRANLIIVALSFCWRFCYWSVDTWVTVYSSGLIYSVNILTLWYLFIFYFILSSIYIFILLLTWAVLSECSVLSYSTGAAERVLTFRRDKAARNHGHGLDAVWRCHYRISWMSRNDDDPYCQTKSPGPTYPSGQEDDDLRRKAVFLSPMNSNLNLKF